MISPLIYQDSRELLANDPIVERWRTKSADGPSWRDRVEPGVPKEVGPTRVQRFDCAGTDYAKSAPLFLTKSTIMPHTLRHASPLNYLQELKRGIPGTISQRHRRQEATDG